MTISTRLHGSLVPPYCIPLRTAICRASAPPWLNPASITCSLPPTSSASSSIRSHTTCVQRGRRQAERQHVPPMKSKAKRPAPSHRAPRTVPVLPLQTPGAGGDMCRRREPMQGKYSYTSNLSSRPCRSNQAGMYCMQHESRIVTGIAAAATSPSFIVTLKGGECGNIILTCRKVTLSSLHRYQFLKGLTPFSERTSPYLHQLV